MSKKKTKIKADRTDIVGRVITAALALAIPIVSFFMNMIYYVVESSVFALISQIQGNTEDDGSTYGYLGFYSVIKKFGTQISNNGDTKETLANLWEALDPVHTAAVVTLVFFALILVTAFVIFFVSVFSNSKKIPLALSTVGFVWTIGMFVAFNKVSVALTTDAIPLSSFFESDLVKIILPFVAKISVFNLSSAWIMMLVLFISIFVWTGAQLIVELGDKPKAKKAK